MFSIRCAMSGHDYCLKNRWQGHLGDKVGIIREEFECERCGRQKVVTHVDADFLSLTTSAQEAMPKSRKTKATNKPKVKAGSVKVRG